MGTCLLQLGDNKVERITLVAFCGGRWYGEIYTNVDNCFEHRDYLLVLF